MASQNSNEPIDGSTPPLTYASPVKRALDLSRHSIQQGHHKPTHGIHMVPSKKPRLVNTSQENGSTSLAEAEQLRKQEEEGCKREKLLFLLEVASDPKMALGSISTPMSLDKTETPPYLSNLSRRTPTSFPSSIAQSGNGDVKEDPKKKERIEYALSVLNSSRNENEARIRRAIEEAKMKRVKKAFSSLSSPTSSSLKAPLSFQKNNEASAVGAIDAGSALLQMQSSSGHNSSPKSGNAPSAGAGNAAAESKQATPVKKTRHARKRTFPEKLMNVLSRKDCAKAITWLPNGDSFVIVSPKLFVTDVLPRFFKQAKFESFTRKLNRWGYKRITKGTNAVAYSHELFLRDKPELCKQMSGGKKGDAEQTQPTEEQPNPEENKTAPKLFDEGGSFMSSSTRPPLDLDRYGPSSTALSSAERLARLSKELERSNLVFNSTPASNSSSSGQSSANLSRMLQKLSQGPNQPQSFMAQCELSRAIKAASARAAEAKAKLAAAMSNKPISDSKNFGPIDSDGKFTTEFPSSLKSAMLRQPCPAPQLTANEALSMYYNRKMQEISARYQNQGSRMFPTMSAAALRAEEERRSYLHRIRQNLNSAPQQNATTPDAAPYPGNAAA